LPMYRHSYSSDDYYFIYRYIKHIRKYYQVVDSRNSVPAHPLEYRLWSIETAASLHIGYLEALRLYDILDIITCCFHVYYRHREQLLSLYYENKNTICLHTDGVYHLYGSQHKESVLRND
jgi:hypothetical protein